MAIQIIALNVFIRAMSIGITQGIGPQIAGLV